MTYRIVKTDNVVYPFAIVPNENKQIMGTRLFSIHGYYKTRMEAERELREMMDEERYKAFAKLADKHGVLDAYSYAMTFGILRADANAWFERWQDERQKCVNESAMCEGDINRGELFAACEYHQHVARSNVRFYS